MQNKHPTITYAYHFLSEALIIFLIALPMMHFYYNFVPYWSYVLMVSSICLLFSFFSVRGTAYGPYIITAPFIMILLYMFNFPIVMSIAFGIVLTWRYIDIRSEVSPSRENSYVRWALVLSTFSVLMNNDHELIIYVFLLFIVLIFGYISGHLAVIHRDDRKRFDRKFWLYIVSGMVIGTTIIYFSFNTVRFIVSKVWTAISYVIIFVGGNLIRLLQHLELTALEQDPDYEDPEELGDDESPIPEEFQESGSVLFENITTIMMWIIVAIIIGFIFYIAYRFFKEKFESPIHKEADDVVSYGSLDKGDRWRNNIFQRFMERYRRSPRDPVRKMVYQFERQASKTNYGRYRYETIENWLQRIGVNMKLETYQKVRYGHMEVSDDDIQQLTQQLKQIEAQFDNERDEHSS